MTEVADKLLGECEQLTAADTAADTAHNTAGAGPVERCRYDALMSCYHDVVGNVSKLIAAATESVHKRDSLSVSLLAIIHCHHCHHHHYHHQQQQHTSMLLASVNVINHV